MTKINRIISFVCCLLVFSFMLQTVKAQSLYTPFPMGFRNTRSNELEGGAELRRVFEKLKGGKTVKVMHIGDSHVKGNYLPRSLGNTLQRYFPNVEFAYYGINGAWARRFYENDMVQRVAAEHPDMVVISFGTNEAHAASIDEKVHAETMNLLTSRIKDVCPGVSFVFTTPPGSYLSSRTGSYTTGRGRKRRTHYTTTKVPNTAKTEKVANSIVSFCRTHHYAVWDIFNIAGGASACNNWYSSGLMASDQIHYLAQGYNLQGKLLGEAIYKAYNGTALSGTQTRMMHGSTPQEQKPYKSVKGF